jgi:hypothetical protein
VSDLPVKRGTSVFFLKEHGHPNISLHRNNHLNGTFGANYGTDATPFTRLVGNFQLPGLFVSHDSQIRAEKLAQVAALALIVYQAPLRLHHCRRFIEARGYDSIFL